MWNLFKSKTADTDMQQIQPADPAQPTVKEMDDVAAVIRKQRDAARADAIRAAARGLEFAAERNAAWVALREIVAAETPSCANIGKRMARIAREALPEYADKQSDQIAA